MPKPAATRPIRVLVVTTSLAGGGAERVASTLLTHLSRKYFSLEVALLRSEVKYSIPTDVVIHALNKTAAWTIPRTIWRLAKVIRARKPDIVLSMISFPNWVTALALRLVSNDPVWIARYASNVEREDLLIRALTPYIFHNACRIVGNSIALSERLQRKIPRFANKLTTIVNPTPFEAMRSVAKMLEEVPSYDKRVVITVGRLAYEKRFDLLIGAFSLVRANTDAELWICGEGPEASKLIALCEKLELTNSVRFVGFCDNPYAMMKAADLFVLTSDHEGSPNALIEAQGLGLPAVATNCKYGPAEIIEHGVTGFLTPCGDVNALAKAMTVLLADSSLRRQFGAAAAERIAQKFGLEAVIADWEELLLSYSAEA